MNVLHVNSDNLAEIRISLEARLWRLSKLLSYAKKNHPTSIPFWRSRLVDAANAYRSTKIQTVI